MRRGCRCRRCSPRGERSAVASEGVRLVPAGPQEPRGPLERLGLLLEGQRV